MDWEILSSCDGLVNLSQKMLAIRVEY
jgi:hypothetical protein